MQNYNSRYTVNSHYNFLSTPLFCPDQLDQRQIKCILTGQLKNCLFIVQGLFSVFQKVRIFFSQNVEMHFTFVSLLHLQSPRLHLHFARCFGCGKDPSEHLNFLNQRFDNILKTYGVERLFIRV